MTDRPLDTDPLPPPEDEEDVTYAEPDPEEERTQMDAAVGDERPGGDDPGELPPPVPGPA